VTKLIHIAHFLVHSGFVKINPLHGKFTKYEKFTKISQAVQKIISRPCVIQLLRKKMLYSSNKESSVITYQLALVRQIDSYQ